MTDQLVPGPNTQTLMAAHFRDLSVKQDQSSIPHQDQRVGWVTAWYDIDVDGAPEGAVEIGPVIPANCLVIGGYADVEELVDTETTGETTTAISLVGANDLYSAGTALRTAGAKVLVPTRAVPLRVTTAGRITLTFSEEAPETGKVLVVLEVIKLQ